MYVSQEGVHRAVGAEIVNNVLNGVSASCFAYGHTGDYLNLKCGGIETALLLFSIEYRTTLCIVQDDKYIDFFSSFNYLY